MLTSLKHPVASVGLLEEEEEVGSPPPPHTHRVGMLGLDLGPQQSPFLGLALTPGS